MAYYTANSDLYGCLPIFPHLGYGRVTEDMIERAVERLYDVADARFLAGKATQSQYDAWSQALKRWADDLYRVAEKGCYR